MGAKQIEIIFQNRVQAVTFADESQVVGGFYSGHIRGWKIEDGQQLGITMQANNRINFVAVSRDGHWIVSGDHGKTATVWDAATRDKVLEYSEHEGPVLAVDISSDCTKVASVDGVAARIFSITSGIRLLPPVPHDHAFGVKFSPDGSLFATASRYHGFRVHNTRDGDILFDSGLENSTGPWPVTPLAWLPDGRQLFVASVGKITCFNVSDSSSSEWFIHDIRSGASVASNGKFIACSAGSSVSLWDCVSHKQIGSIITHTALMECFSLSSSGGYLACGLKDGRIIIHNLRDILPHEYFCLRLPLIQLSDEALELWIRDDLMNTDMLLSKGITSASSPSHHVLANRALLRARLKRLEFATADAKESLQVRPSPIGYIAMAVVLLGQGDREDFSY
ncbi:hypothetical protein PISMIDRAFT_562737 [Pisolithus microcarpus 441]|uniref:Uncharacterized protein n=1 Tax=Pisolithus microcarpus 441 TaxID=765257 RepID=A0A0C9Z4U0_9AGAM|nr:hypothetical protein PISMIDRAFT_562737 [Pisolithus microcarpus 441]